VLSNREYDINFNLFNSGFFKKNSPNGTLAENKISVVVYGSTDVSILGDTEYVMPFNEQIMNFFDIGWKPFPDRQQFEHIVNNIMYYGYTGQPVLGFEDAYIYSTSQINSNLYVTGEMAWKPMNSKFMIENNSGKEIVNIGILIETNLEPELNIPFFISDFTYRGADILVQDASKNSLIIEENFGDSFLGGIQKLRVYDKGLNTTEILHNVNMDARVNPNLNLIISNGGRMISRYSTVDYGNQQAAGSDFRKSIKYRNVDGSYKDLYAMLEIMVLIKSRSNPDVELVKFKKVAETGWLALIGVDNYTYDFIIPDDVTTAHSNEILFAEIKFQWSDPSDIDNIFEKIVVANVTTKLIDNTIKNY